MQKIFLFTLQFVAFLCVCTDGIIRSNSQGDRLYLFAEFHVFFFTWEGKYELCLINEKNRLFGIFLKKLLIILRL